MRNSIILFLLSILVLPFQAYSQKDSIAQARTTLKGKVTDAGTGEPILFGDLALFQSGKLMFKTETDFDGNYVFLNIFSGLYDIEVTYVGYHTTRQENAKVDDGQINYVNLLIREGSFDCRCGCTYIAPIFNCSKLKTFNDTAQLSTLKGKVTDESSGEPILFGNVALFQNGKLVTGSETDFDGNYIFSNIEPGIYNVEASYVGYQTKQMTAIKVKRETANICNIRIDESSTCCGGFIHYPPVIKHDDFTIGKTFTAKDIRRSPVK